MRQIIIPTVAALAALTAGGLAAQETGGKPFRFELTGEAEVPGPGDPDGSGTASLRVNPGVGQVCYTLTVEDIADATAAHIHIGEAGEAGGVLVGLNAPTTGSSQGCVDVTRQQAFDLMRNPDGYYVNVHNAEFPSGAVRGQLSD